MVIIKNHYYQLKIIIGNVKKLVLLYDFKYLKTNQQKTLFLRYKYAVSIHLKSAINQRASLKCVVYILCFISMYFTVHNIPNK